VSAGGEAGGTAKAIDVDPAAVQLQSIQQQSADASVEGGSGATSVVVSSSKLLLQLLLLLLLQPLDKPAYFV